MATITSIQSGNFSSGSTWVGGVVPVDGDAFVVAAGHTVTVDSSISIPATGYVDSTISGTLQHTTSGISSIRMNGSLTVASGGTYHMRGDARLDFRGTLAQNRGLRISDAASTNFIAEGEDGMPSTTTSGITTERATSISVGSTANFAVGEWIAVYNNTTTQTGNAGAETLRDEGFWIHDIDVNRFFFRQFVGPETTVVSASGTSLVVANSKVFRVGQKIIFGTGANRNVHTISAINYDTHTLTLSGTITGTVDGLTVYETGTDKIHGASEKVRKVATVTTASALSSSSTIVVANANKFAAGDDIWIEARSEAANTTDGTWNAYETVRTVASVSGNTITLTAAIGYNVVSGALVTRMTRRIQIRAMSDTDYFSFWQNYYVGNYTRKLIFKDVYLWNCGTDSGNPGRGIELRGFSSTNSPPVTLTETVPAFSQQAWIEGVVLRGSQRVPDVGGFFLWDSRYAQARCCVCTRTYDGFGAPWYNPGQCVYNSITTRNQRWGFRTEGLHEWGEVAYNYISRCYHHFRIINQYEIGCGYHHNIGDACNEYAFSSLSGNNHGTAQVYKHKHTGVRYGFNQDPPNFAGLTYSSVRFLSGLTLPTSATPGTPQAGFYYTQMDRGHNSFTCVTILEDEFEYDRVRQFAYNTERIWDSNENAWRVYFRYDYMEYGCGWSETVYVPAGTALRAKCSVKYAPGYSGNYPIFEARSIQSNVGPNRFGNSGGDYSSYLTGGATSTQYTAAAANDYEEKQLTISAVDFPRYIQVGVHGNSTNMARGFWMKNPEIFLDKPYINPAFATLNAGSGPRVSSGFAIRTAFNQFITRLGGL